MISLQANFHILVSVIIIPEHQFILDQITLLGDKRIQRDENNVLHLCVFTFIDRLYLSLTNCKKLINTTPHETEIYFALSLILRATMVDAMLCGELDQSLKECLPTEDFKPFTQKCLSFLEDGIKQTSSHLRTMKKNTENFNQEFADSIQNSLESELKSIYNANQTPMGKISTTQIRNLLDQSVNYHEYQSYFDIQYTALSKVEHFGLLYFRWANMPMKHKEELIYKGFELCMMHYYTILILLSFTGLEKDFVRERVKDFMKFADSKPTK